MQKAALHSIYKGLHKQAGFTLVEMAVVLVIAAGLISMGLGAMNAQLLASNYSTTKKRQEAVKDALINYFGVNHRLPCPDDPAAGAPLIDGNEVPPTAANAHCVPNFGVLPYVTLGLPRSAAEDGWGNLFSYKIFDDGGAPTVCPTGVSWGYKPCFGTGKAGGLTINEGTVAAATLVRNDFAAIVISHGSNGLGAWVVQGTQNAAPKTCEEAHNAPTALPLPAGCVLAANTFYKGERTLNDDVVAYLTANDIIIPLAKQGAIKSAPAQVAEDLDQIYFDRIGRKTACNTSVTSATIAIPANLNTNDPWGNPYQVLEGTGSATNNFPICICSTMGTGAAPAPTVTSCGEIAPTKCRAITNTEVTQLTGLSPPC